MRKKTQSIEDSQYATYDNLCYLEDDLMNRLRKYEKNRDYDQTYEKLVNQLRNVSDSKTGMYKNCLVIEEVKKLRKQMTAIPPEILEKYLPRQRIENPQVLENFAYT